MGAAADIKSDVQAILDAPWARRKGQVVPTTESVALRNGAVDLDAVVLYADLAHSTQLARKFALTTAAKVVRAYLSTMTRLIRFHGGEVRSFDGDRVMGVFLGDAKNSNAGRCALRMNWAMREVLRPKVAAKFPVLSQKGFQLTHCVGIHASSILVVRGGIRANNDLVFVGEGPNLAAKLSDQRASPYHAYITHTVYGRLNEAAKLKEASGPNMWQQVYVTMAGERWQCYRSNWWWSP